MSERNFLYGKQQTKASNASGVEGVLLLSLAGSYFFRVYCEGGEFTDYELRHNDLPVIISEDALASFYEMEETNILDYSPEILGLEKV